MAKVNWNAGEYATNAGFETMPPGRYLALVKDSEDKPTNKKTGRYFEFEFEVIRPEANKGRKLWARLNVINQSAEAQRIGREQFNALSEACGLDKSLVKDTTQLHNRLVVLIVGVEKGLKRDSVNVVNGFLKPGSEATAIGEGYIKEKQARQADAPAPALRREESAAQAAAAIEARRAERAASGVLDDDIPF